MSADNKKARISRALLHRLDTSDCQVRHSDVRSLFPTHHGRLLVRPAPALAGLIEIRGIGVCPLPFEPMGVVSLVVDLAASDAARMPEPAAATTEINGILLPRLGVAPEHDAFATVMASLTTAVRPPVRAPVVATHHPP